MTPRLPVHLDCKPGWLRYPDGSVTRIPGRNLRGRQHDHGSGQRHDPRNGAEVYNPVVAHDRVVSTGDGQFDPSLTRRLAGTNSCPDTSTVASSRLLPARGSGSPTGAGPQPPPCPRTMGNARQRNWPWICRPDWTLSTGPIPARVELHL
jgi:hypothetical protein